MTDKFFLSCLKKSTDSHKTAMDYFAQHILEPMSRAEAMNDEDLARELFDVIARHELDNRGTAAILEVSRRLIERCPEEIKITDELTSLCEKSQV